MAADPNPALRAELKAALGVLRPQIKGLIDFSKIVVSASPVAEAVRVQIQARQHRESLLIAAITTLDNVITALNELEADDYPNLPLVAASPDIIDALHAESDAIAYALAIFETRLLASEMKIRLGPAAIKP